MKDTARYTASNQTQIRERRQSVMNKQTGQSMDKTFFFKKTGGFMLYLPAILPSYTTTLIMYDKRKAVSTIEAFR